MRWSKAAEAEARRRWIPARALLAAGSSLDRVVMHGLFRRHERFARFSEIPRLFQSFAGAQRRRVQPWPWARGSRSIAWPWPASLALRQNNIISTILPDLMLQ
jgi:hypothetical protein